MFKRITAAVLLLALISTNFSRFFAYAGFEVNKQYIAQNLCINKNRPWMHCNGQCYFMKKMHQAEENDRKQTAKDNLSRMEVFLFQEPFKLSLCNPVITGTQKAALPHYHYRYSSHYIDAIFRPPKSLV